MFIQWINLSNVCHIIKWSPISYQLSVINYEGLRPSVDSRDLMLIFPIGLSSVHLFNNRISYQQGFHFQILTSKPFYLYVLLLLFSNWNAATHWKMVFNLQSIGVNILIFSSQFEHFVFLYFRHISCGVLMGIRSKVKSKKQSMSLVKLAVTFHKVRSSKYKPCLFEISLTSWSRSFTLLSKVRLSERLR